MSATAQLSTLGVSIWLDDLSRDRITSGNLAALIADHHVVGVTTNPTIFQQAISQGDAYAERVAALGQAGHSTEDAVFALMVDDVRDACDIFQPQFDASGGVNGRVSIEVSPVLAHDTEATIAQATTLAKSVGRSNVLIKIPATKAGLPAITETLARGISVNVTLIFSLERYREVVEAYFAGLEEAATRGVDISTLHSVASFFVSRMDTAVDPQLDAIGSDEARALRSLAGIANARLAYEAFEELFASDRATGLLAKGGNIQRPLWASTGVKDPALPPTLYVTQLAAAHTVNTMPEKTLQATAELDGIDGDQVTDFYSHAHDVLDGVARLGISYEEVTQLLEDEGVSKFIDSWHDLLATVEKVLSASR
ncbi:MAG: transaldolase [Pontimonas sp.]